MDVISKHLIQTMNAWPPEVIWLLMLLICFGTILAANRFYGPSGLFAYIAVSIIIANIQVLKAVQFNIYPKFLFIISKISAKITQINILKMLVVGGIMLYINVKLSLIVFTTLPIIIFATKIFQKYMKKAFEEALVFFRFF